jgi:hypothetical protein
MHIDAHCSDALRGVTRTMLVNPMAPGYSFAVSRDSFLLWLVFRYDPESNYVSTGTRADVARDPGIDSLLLLDDVFRDLGGLRERFDQEDFLGVGDAG